ncbi:exonuclease V a 5' deoxyribonuclease-domain-containing protein [Flagelloscypha sp. PMI_526]|nr:exonuclease V a 5' deoxyribonuclease-domain-containing protein [Flagelloscypha sp. PMI_526]
MPTTITSSDTVYWSSLSPEEVASFYSISESNSAAEPQTSIELENKPLSARVDANPHLFATQYDYGLRQKRFRPLEDRPATFETGQGRTITVVKDIAVKNFKRVQRGQAVHKELEREIRPEEIELQISSQEESWARRLLVLIESFQGIMLEGLAREIPVFGIINDHVVVGIIDELKRTRIHDTGTKPANSKRARHQSSSISQRTFPDSLPSSQTTTHEPPPTHTLRIIDSKTRKSRSVPPDADAVPSRIQLMLYHRLLDCLLRPQCFDFIAFWARNGVDPTKHFSPLFVEQAQLPKDMRCLNDLEKEWTKLIPTLEVNGVDPTLALVYRYISKSPRAREKTNTRTNVLDVEEQMVLMAQIESISSQPLEAQDPILLHNLEQALAIRFQMNENFLDAHIRDAFEFWHGKRRPKGVSLEQTHRCNTCEYRDGCEWRAEQAELYLKQKGLNKTESSMSVS